MSTPAEPGDRVDRAVLGYTRRRGYSNSEEETPVTTATTSTHPRATAPPSTPGAAFSDVISAAVGVVSAKVDDWSNRLNGVAAGAGEASGAVGNVADRLAEGGNAQRQAGVRGVEAGLVGKSPVWAAIKGAWTGGSTAVKVAVVTAGVALILVLVLSPVLLIVVLLTVPVVILVSKARSARK